MIFTTHVTSQVPLNFDKDILNWRAVELSTYSPWFVCRLYHTDREIFSTFLIGQEEDVVGLATGSAHTRLVGVTMALLTRGVASGGWSFVKIVRIERLLEAPQGLDVVFTTEDGAQYAGYPLKPRMLDPQNLELVLDLSGTSEGTDKTA